MSATRAGEGCRTRTAHVVDPPLFAVADGMGGAQAGEIASRLAAGAIEEGASSDLGEQGVERLVREANARIFERALGDPATAGMGTTTTIALVDEIAETLAIGHVGDSQGVSDPRPRPRSTDARPFARRRAAAVGPADARRGRRASPSLGDHPRRRHRAGGRGRHDDDPPRDRRSLPPLLRRADRHAPRRARSCRSSSMPDTNRGRPPRTSSRRRTPWVATTTSPSSSSRSRTGSRCRSRSPPSSRSSTCRVRRCRRRAVSGSSVGCRSRQPLAGPAPAHLRRRRDPDRRDPQRRPVSGGRAMSPRNRELVNLVLATAVGGAAFASAWIVRDGGPSSTTGWSYAGGLARLYLVAHLVVRRLAPLADPTLLPAAGLLTAIGLTTIYRLDPDAAKKQVVVGRHRPRRCSSCVLSLLRFDYRVLERYKYVFGVTAIVLLLLPSLPKLGPISGVRVNGVKLWLEVGPVRFQPGEFAKVFLIVFLAGYLRDKRETLARGRPKDLGPLLVIWGAAMLVLVQTSDLGPALLSFGIFLAMVYVATGRALYVAVGTAMFVGGAAALYNALSRASRPASRCGSAPGRTRPCTARQRPAGAASELRVVPAREEPLLDRERRLRRHGHRQGDVHEPRRRSRSFPLLNTDFIYSAIAQEIGLIGACGVLLVIDRDRDPRDADRARSRRTASRSSSPRGSRSASRCRPSSSSAACCASCRSPASRSPSSPTAARASSRTSRCSPCCSSSRTGATHSRLAAGRFA